MPSLKHCGVAVDIDLDSALVGRNSRSDLHRAVQVRAPVCVCVCAWVPSERVAVGVHEPCAGRNTQAEREVCVRVSTTACGRWGDSSGHRRR